MSALSFWSVVGLVNLLVTLIVWAWFTHCNERTHSEIRTLILSDLDKLQHLAFWRGNLNSVYNAHFWRKLTFRDPGVIYPESLRSIYQAQRKQR